MSSPTRAPESCDFRKIRVCWAFLRYARFVTDGKTQKPKPAINPVREGARTAQLEPGHRSVRRRGHCPHRACRGGRPRRGVAPVWRLGTFVPVSLFLRHAYPPWAGPIETGECPENDREPDQPHGHLADEAAVLMCEAEAAIGARSDVLPEIKAARGYPRDARRMLHARADECYTPERMYTPPRACRAAASGKLSAGLPFG